MKINKKIKVSISERKLIYKWYIENKNIII